MEAGEVADHVALTRGEIDVGVGIVVVRHPATVRPGDAGRRRRER